MSPFYNGFTCSIYLFYQLGGHSYETFVTEDYRLNSKRKYWVIQFCFYLFYCNLKEKDHINSEKNVSM